MKRTFLIALLLPGFFLLQSTNAQQTGDPYSGTYKLITEQADLTLQLTLKENSALKGTLTSTTGIQYTLDGIAEAGAASGICSDEYGSVFFELYVESMELVLSLIEPDGNNTPDYSTATYLSFTKKPETNDAQIQNNTAMNTAMDQPGAPATGSAGKGIGNPGWGFEFIPSEGWTYQPSGEAMILGHTSIPGLILIFPHMLQNMQELGQEMHKGIEEGNNYLTLKGDVEAKGDRMLAGNYMGMMDGQQAKARGFGTLSPHGGGAFVLAISTPEMLGDAIISEAENICRNMIYKKMETSGLAMHFTGRWASFTTNTSTWIQFYPDGTYDEQYESSYSGELSGGGNWGAYGGENAKGRWTVQGNRDQGRITVRLANGNEVYYDYRVHEERGEKYYSEYWFNGKLYSKSRE